MQKRGIKKIITGGKIKEAFEIEEDEKGKKVVVSRKAQKDKDKEEEGVRDG